MSYGALGLHCPGLLWGHRKRVRKFLQENREKFKHKQHPKKFTNSELVSSLGLPRVHAPLGWQILISDSVHLGNLQCV